MSNCHTDGSVCGPYGFTFGSGRNNVEHCDGRRPDHPSAATVESGHYPPIIEGNGITHPRSAVMYDGVLHSPYPPQQRGGYSYTSPQAGTYYEGGNCGKYPKDVDCGRVIFENHPSELSFRGMESDTWFYFLYDMGLNGSAVGSPCYRIQTETRSGGTTSSTSGTDPVTGNPTSTPGASTTDDGGSTQKCIPCTQFHCTPVNSYCRYTYQGPDETGDPDCPYPLIFGIGTDSVKVVVEYDALTDQLPQGCTDFSFVYAPDSIDTDVWNETLFSPGDPVTTTQNPWVQSEAGFADFMIKEFDSGTAVGLRVKIGIRPKLQDNTVDPEEDPEIIGTEWELIEVMSQGQNYNVNDTFTVEYDYTHANGVSTTFTIDLKITAVGNVSVISGVTDFSLLNVGDKLNGHTITRTAHQDVDHMPYHVMYLDGSGNDFVKDTQYTSSRNHVVTAKAGFGIKDRAFFGGFYEFFNKSVQYTVHTVKPEAPYTYPGYTFSIDQPEVLVTVTNGQVSSLSITDGGQNWDKLGEEPIIGIGPPFIESGIAAVVEATFTSGVLTGIEIVNPGSGYNDLDPPSVYVINYYTRDDEAASPGTPVSDLGTSNVTTVTTGDDFEVDGPNGTKLSLSNADLIKDMAMQESFEGTVTLSETQVTAIKNETGVDLAAGESYTADAINGLGLVVTNPENANLNLKSSVVKEGSFTPVNQPISASVDMNVVNTTAGPTSYETQTPGNTPKLDYDASRAEDMLRTGYTSEGLDDLRGIQSIPSLELPAESQYILPEQWHADRRAEKGVQEDAIDNMFDGLEQKDEDLVYRNPDVYVETTQRRFVDLPIPSTYTKYYIKQYRPDPNIKTTIEITVGHNVLENGCNHLLADPNPLNGGAALCPGPAGFPFANSSTTTSDTSDPDANGNTTTTNTTVAYTYSLSGLLGPGCKSWSATGTMKVDHNLTKSKETYASAVRAYGNPFDL